MAELLMEDDEDWLRATPPVVEDLEDAGAKKRQKKVLTLDDLLQAEQKEEIRQLKGKKSKRLLDRFRAKSHLYMDSDEEDEKNSHIVKVFKVVEEKLTGVEEEVDPEWGVAVFIAPLEFPSLPQGCAPSLQQALHVSKGERHETSLEELARLGFFRAWALSTNRCDESTLRWAYHQMAYSIDDSVERAACKFLCDLISRPALDSGAPFQMDWLPTLVDVKQTLVVYGYKEGSRDGENIDCSSESIQRNPPKNLRSVLEFLVACFEKRNMQPFYSLVEIETLLVIMVYLTLARGLLEILDKVQDCILVLIRYFSPEDWREVCLHMAASISGLTERPHNGIYILGVMSGLGKRSVDLQRRLALHELAKPAQSGKLLSTPREVVALFEKVNLKAKDVDFRKLYYQLVIADIFLWCNEGLNDEIARSKWLKFLNSCSRQIFIGDERPFATKLRYRASFLIQQYEHDGYDREESPANSVEEEPLL